MAGFRFGDVSHTINSRFATESGEQVAAGYADADYLGFGPRAGLLGRRYLGRRARWSIYSDTHASILAGYYEERIANFTLSPQLATGQQACYTRIVPVLEIEVGGSWQWTDRARLSGGWMLQSWWDLGLQEITTNTDDANILAFDGYFIRGEFRF
jgi:hypothetical protein